MRKCYFLPLLAAFLLAACSAKVRSTISSPRSPTPDDQEIVVIGVADPLPEGTEILGTFKIGDSGFSVNCGYDVAISSARGLAREAGANVIKITEHIPPSVLGSSCHRIQGQLAYEPDIRNFSYAFRPAQDAPDSALFAENCAAVHFYRFSGAGALVSYDLKANGEVLCRMKNNCRDSFKLKAPGSVVITARTEVTAEVMLDLQPGYHYYVRCGMTMGAMVGRPTLTQVDAISGKTEFDSIKIK